MSGPALHRPDFDAALAAVVGAGVLGVQLRVWDTRGEWTGTAGAREIGSTEPPGIDDRFWIGSTSKPFTAVAVLTLVQEERITLDEALGKMTPPIPHEYHEYDEDWPEGFNHAFRPGGPADVGSRGLTKTWIARFMPPTGKP